MDNPNTQTITIITFRSREYLQAQALATGRDVPDSVKTEVPIAELQEDTRRVLLAISQAAGEYPQTLSAVPYSKSYEVCPAWSRWGDIRLQLDAEVVTPADVDRLLAEAVWAIAVKRAEEESAQAERQAKEAARREAARAEAEAEAERKAAQGEATAERDRWIREHGSARLKKYLDAGMVGRAADLYADERRWLELPGWEWDRDSLEDRDARQLSEAAVDALLEARARWPLGETELLEMRQVADKDDEDEGYEYPWREVIRMRCSFDDRLVIRFVERKEA
jgi:hypothetical protein